MAKRELRAALEPTADELIGIGGEARFQRSRAASSVSAAPCLRAKPVKP